MFYAYVKQAKQGELAEGENPMHTIRIGAEEFAALEEKRDMYLSNGWELAEESEWVDGGETVEGETQEDGSVVTSDGEVIAAEDIADAEEVLAAAEAEAAAIEEVKEAE